MIKRWVVEYLRGFEKNLKKLLKRTALKLLDAGGNLVKGPRPPGYKKLKGYNRLHRIREGGYRIVYKLDDKNKVMKEMHPLTAAQAVINNLSAFVAPDF